MGRFADAVSDHLRAGLADRAPRFDWATEYDVAGTPVDVGGVHRPAADGTELVAVELEWRRADPADNAAKLFRHLAEGRIDADRVTVVHLFTRYYDLVSGGVSAKRANAEFVGSVAAETLDALTYHPLTFDLDPPKRGADRPSEWRAAADAAVEETVRRVDAR
jgi:hypothetical protein